MLERLLSSVIGGLINSIVKALSDWLNQKELEALKAREAALKGKIDSMQEAGASEKRIAKAAEKVVQVNARASSLGERLKAIADAAKVKAEGDASNTFQ